METLEVSQQIKRIGKDENQITLNDSETVQLMELIHGVNDLSGQRIEDKQFQFHQLLSEKIKTNPERADEYLNMLQFINEMVLLLGSNFDFTTSLWKPLNEVCNEM